MEQVRPTICRTCRRCLSPPAQRGARLLFPVFLASQGNTKLAMPSTYHRIFRLSSQVAGVEDC